MDRKAELPKPENPRTARNFELRPPQPSSIETVRAWQDIKRRYNARVNRARAELQEQYRQAEIRINQENLRF